MIALGERMKRRLVEEKGADPSRVHVIHNWADCQAITPGPKDNAFARAHGLADRFVLMHSGNVGLSQNLDLLVEAAARLQSRERLVIAIVGDGARRQALAGRGGAPRALTNVRFFPYQPKELLHESFATADAFLVSLKPGLEGYIVPSKLYGILAAGRPFVAAVDPSCEAATIAREHAVRHGRRAGRRRRAGRPRSRRSTTIRPERASWERTPDARRCATTAGPPCRAYHELFAGLNRKASRGMIKRLFDASLSAAGLVVSAPLWCVIPIAIKIEDGGPVFFPQERVGLDGRVFLALKFRSMRPDAETLTGPVQATENDPRVTRVGRVLRATAMDELPQLVNILRGDMSFVGPRPLRPGEVDVRGDGQLVALEQIPGYKERHAVRPGLTGLTQVYAPRDISRTSKFRLDRLYMKRAGFWLDLRLILLSFWITGRGQWEARGRKV